MDKIKPRGATSYHETSIGIIPRSKLVKLEIKGIKRGVAFLTKSVRGKKQLTPNLILDLHKESFGWIFPIWAGKYRVIEVQYSGKEAPHHFRVPELVENLCLDLQERLKNMPLAQNLEFIEKVAEMLAWFQYKFIWIHPFNDYNGRTGRMLTSFILLSLGLRPIEIIVEKGVGRNEYIAAMQKADEGNLNELENIISKALIESMS